ncbi:hypothetical protein E5A73_08615 [Sphingomonas gei]|uniref:Uncharacterized protein n=2 Tax=Sphingomonas gei TaxID=1395960 RepID=A0A4S1XEZ9_9SPHN|nr:hypothetical protein E5A73_08615 [Sphingomonas gei]
MGASETRRDRLFHHDWRIAVNSARATFAGWQDRLIAGTMLLIAMTVVRSWFTDPPWRIAAWVALGAGIVVGMVAGRLVAARLRFHGSDGLLAAEALQSLTRRRYMAASHGAGIAVLAATTLIARPSLLIISAPAYLAGAFAVHMITNLARPVPAIRKARPGWTVRRWLRQPGAGIVAAMILLLSLLWANTLGTNALIAVVGIEVILLALTLTLVDDSVVRFMTIAGHGARAIVLHHAQSLLPFTGLAVPICLVAFGPVAAGIVAAASIATLLLLAARVLAYRLYGKRFADLLVSIHAGVLLLAGYAAPIALPFVAIAILWQLQRRGAAKTWLLA